MLGGPSIADPARLLLIPLYTVDNKRMHTSILLVRFLRMKMYKNVHVFDYTYAYIKQYK